MRRLAPLLLLALYGAGFALTAFGHGVSALDDHPGQLFRLWHFLERSLPSGRWTADWSPDWWGGYPELTFYPPGFALVGAVIRLVSFWQLSVDAVYQIVCAVTLLLPAVGTYLLVSRLTSDGWLALPPAFLALTLSAGLRAGVEEAVRWGGLTARLAIGVLPLLLLSLRDWLDAGRRPAWAPVVTAALVLAHPAAAPVAAVTLVTAALLALAVRGRQTIAAVAAVAALAVGLVAFWALPFVVHRDWVRPLAWGDADAGRVLRDLAGRPVLLGVGVAVPLGWLAVLGRRRAFEALLAVLPLVFLGVVLADGALFRRGWSPVEPARLADGLVFTALWAGGLGVATVVGRLTAGRPHGLGRPVVAIAMVGLLAFAATKGRGEPSLTLWPSERARRWPTLDAVSRAHDLPRLWAALRGTDRALFLTSSLRLDADPAWYATHSHVLSLAPVLAGREIVHGTYTHPAPLAARFYAGTAEVPRRIELLTERLDGQRLLGQPLARVSPDAFEAFARRLRIASVVVPAALADRVGFLRDRYTPRQTVAGFVVFERRDRPWPQLERLTHRRYRVLVPPTGGVWVPTGIAAYPLWHAKSGRGPLETRADAWGLLEFRVPLDVFEAELVYAEGAVEWGALVLSALSLVAWSLWAWGGPRAARPRRPRR